MALQRARDLLIHNFLGQLPFVVDHPLFAIY
jgi:hypothetical protein